MISDDSEKRRGTNDAQGIAFRRPPLLPPRQIPPVPQLQGHALLMMTTGTVLLVSLSPLHHLRKLPHHPRRRQAHVLLTMTTGTVLPVSLSPQRPHPIPAKRLQIRQEEPVLPTMTTGTALQESNLQLHLHPPVGEVEAVEAVAARNACPTMTTGTVLLVLSLHPHPRLPVVGVVVAVEAVAARSASRTMITGTALTGLSPHLHHPLAAVAVAVVAEVVAEVVVVVAAAAAQNACPTTTTGTAPTASSHRGPRLSVRAPLPSARGPQRPCQPLQRFSREQQQQPWSTAVASQLWFRAWQFSF